jgi:alkylhydroperoxidase family enzyme
MCSLLGERHRTLFTEKEQAALALVEAVTLIGVAGVSDEVWNGVTRCFNQKDVVHLLMATATINVWNRLAVSTHQRRPSQ